jgi:hypothetical protein
MQGIEPSAFGSDRSLAGAVVRDRERVPGFLTSRFGGARRAAEVAGCVAAASRRFFSVWRVVVGERAGSARSRSCRKERFLTLVFRPDGLLQCARVV